ncbi:MAG: lipoyl synthase [Candidatus Omnitrophica bacterium]|nr:lipoyl synthase [Candidatus Omnitrophota bacterium]
MKSKHYPEWLRKKLPAHSSLAAESVLVSCGVNTVCDSALCPNRSECYSKKRATFMILGKTCTRHCGFCEVNKGVPEKVDSAEPKRIAEASRELGLEHAVITSVTRDDLNDGGAGHFAACIKAVREELPKARIEVLTPDFRGDYAALKVVLNAGPAVFNHNIETVERLYSDVRPEAGYRHSLDILRFAREYAPDVVTKSGLMVGLGETDEEVESALRDLHRSGCDVATIGQYLRPPHGNCEVKRFVEPAVFNRYRDYGMAIGFKAVFAGPFVRSSYEAGEVYEGIQVTR